MCANYNTVGTGEIIKNVYINNITFKHLDGVFKENVGQCLIANTENVKISISFITLITIAPVNVNIIDSIFL